jgi:hypothetical protein
MNISLLVEHLPIVITNQSTISVSPGQSTHLTCQVTAVPVPAVSWYSLKKNQEPAMIKSRGDLSISIIDYKDGRMTSSLILHNVTQDHYGGYSCNATNTEGEVWSIFVTAQHISLLHCHSPTHLTISGLSHHKTGSAFQYQWWGRETLEEEE